jgi:VWFA-related protein
MRWLLLLCFCLVIISISAEDYEVAVTSVNIWVKAVDSSGMSVKGLTASDFQIYEDNKQVPTTCFEESTFELASHESPLRGSNEPPKKFVLFLDLYNTTNIEFKRVRPALQEFVRKLKGTNSEMMLAALLSSGKLGVVATFTPDMDRIRRLIDQAKGNFTRDNRIKANDKELAELLTLGKSKEQERGLDSGSGGGGGDTSEVVATTSPDIEVREIAIKNAYRLAQSYYAEEKRMTEYSLAARLSS